MRHKLSEEEEFRRTLEQLKTILDSAGVQKLVDVFLKRMEAEPERLRLEHQLRQKAHETNARFYSSNRVYFLIGLSLCLIFLGWLVWLLKGDKDTLLPVLTAVIGLLAGAGGGFIFGQSKRSND